MFGDADYHLLQNFYQVVFLLRNPLEEQPSPDVKISGTAPSVNLKGVISLSSKFQVTP